MSKPTAFPTIGCINDEQHGIQDGRMIFRSYEHLGKSICKEWGRESRLTTEEMIKSAKTDEKIFYVQVETACELREAAASLRRIASKTTDQPSDCDLARSRDASDAFRDSLLARQGLVPITQEMRMKLRTRANNALIDGNIVSLNQIDRDTLKKIRNCGDTTIRELIALRDKYIPPRKDENVEKHPTTN